MQKFKFVQDSIRQNDNFMQDSIRQKSMIINFYAGQEFKFVQDSEARGEVCSLSYLSVAR